MFSFIDSLSIQVNDDKLKNDETKIFWVQKTLELINDYWQSAVQQSTAKTLRKKNSNSLIKKWYGFIC